MLEDFEGLSIELLAISRADSGQSIFLFLKLNIGESSAHSISETLQFTLMDVAELRVVIMHLLLGQRSGQVADKDVCFGVELLILHLQAHSDDFTVDFRVVQCFLAFDCVCFSQELDVSIVERLVSLFVDNHDCLDAGEALLLYELEEVEVIEFAGQVADVE